MGGGPTGGPSPTGSDLNRLLRAVHALPAAASGLPGWDPLGDFRNRLADATELDAADRAFLAGRADQLEAALAGVTFALPRVVLHGDAHIGNLIDAPHGPVLCDFDSCCVGPAEWDLAPLPVSALRFGRPRRAHADLSARYGFDITGWHGFEVLQGIRDLKIVAGVLPGPGREPRAAAEFRRRMASLRAGRTSERWQRVQ